MQSRGRERQREKERGRDEERRKEEEMKRGEGEKERQRERERESREQKTITRECLKREETEEKHASEKIYPGEAFSLEDFSIHFFFSFEI